MGVLPPKEEVSSSPATSNLLSAEEQAAEQERQRRLQAVFSQRIGVSPKDLRLTPQTLEAPKVVEKEAKQPKLMPGLSWDNLASESLLLSFENPI